MSVKIGTVLDISDAKDGERIKVQVLPVDKYTPLEKIPYSFPLLPKMLHVKPKVGEAVLVLCEDENKRDSQRYYIGPIISQSHLLYKEDAISSTALLKGGPKNEDDAASTRQKAIGAFAEDEDVALYGRKNGDIIITDNDIRIRCGVHLVNNSNTSDISFNRGAASYIKLKYYDTPLEQNEKKYNGILEEILDDNVENTNEHNRTVSTATIVADKINLISPNGSPYIETSDVKEGISDEEMKKIINQAHQLPYGDVLVNFMSYMIKMFKSHTHKYHGMPPCPDANSAKFDLAYGTTESEYKDKLLSKDIRIN